MKMIDDSDDATANNCAVPNLYIEWDFKDQIKATWLAGALKGRIVTTLISEFNQAKWETMTALHNYGVSFGQATKTEKRTAVWHMVEQHCREQLAKHEEII